MAVTHGGPVTVQAADIGRYNIYTTDTPRPGRGDLTSNWVVARHLRQTQPNAEVNLYISPVFHERFEGVEPAFTPSVNVQPIPFGSGVINVYSQTNPALSADSDTKRAMAEQRKRLHEGNVRTCNLAFTVDVLEHLTRRTASSARADGEDYMAQREALGDRAFSARVLDDTKLNLERSQARPNQGPHAAPFLSFNVLRHRDTQRLRSNTHHIMLEGSGGALFPLFEVLSGFSNRMLFIQRGEPNTPSIRIESASYIGFAHADSTKAIEDYIDNMERLANAQPDRNFVVFVTKHLANRKGRAVADGDWPILFSQDDALVTKLVEIMRNADRFRDSRLGQARNLAVLEFKGLPMDVTDAVIHGANLRVLITGTMSLSQALQYAKPIVYEARNWHDMIAYDMGRFLANGNSALFHRNIVITEGFRFLDNLNAQALQVVRWHYAYGVSPRNDRLEADWDLYQANYQSEQMDLLRYRDEVSFQVPGDTHGQLKNPAYDLPRGHLLDNVAAYCSDAADILDEFRRSYAQRGLCEKCFSTRAKRREAAEKIMRKLSPVLESRFQNP
ncbi:MAG: hypothetical protein AAF465_02185 [Pseudomonadota bacterium]